ncbi:MAG: STAS domain-containing protein [Terracidiphilus sp.]|jgi:anti-anti-sigma factor
MCSVLCNPAIVSSIPAEWSAPAEATERINLTELVRGHDQDLFARLAPVVRRQSLLLDLELVERIDAAGIAALISLYRCATDAGYRFAIFNPSQHVAEILTVVGLDRILVSQNVDRVSHSRQCIERPAA